MEHLDEDDVSLHDDKELGSTDAEGVWSPDIEQSFQEALALYPPCGRRKIILSDEGKMYGRNELIARYIKMRTGKTRTRKQVSSHIQVLARRKLREWQAKIKGCGSDDGSGLMRLDQATKEKAMQTMSSMSSAQIVSSALHNKASILPPPPASYANFLAGGIQAGPSQDVKPFSQGSFPMTDTKPVSGMGGLLQAPQSPTSARLWEGRSIAASKLRLVEFSAFKDIQADDIAVDIRQIYDKFPEKEGGLKELYDRGPQNAFFLVKCWADINDNFKDQPNSYYWATSQYESSDNMTIRCSTKICSFSKQVVEKLETIYAHFENGRYVYRIQKSPMCEYMVNFITKLKELPERYMMNSVLENFTVLQVVEEADTHETLLCIAYVFEVSDSDHGAQHHIYKLVKD